MPTLFNDRICGTNPGIKRHTPVVCKLQFILPHIAYYIFVKKKVLMYKRFSNCLADLNFYLQVKFLPYLLKIVPPQILFLP